MEGGGRTHSSRLILGLPAKIQLTVVSTKQPHENEIDRTYRVVLRVLGSHIRELGAR